MSGENMNRYQQKTTLGWGDALYTIKFSVDSKGWMDAFQIASNKRTPVLTAERVGFFKRTTLVQSGKTFLIPFDTDQMKETHGYWKFQVSESLEIFTSIIGSCVHSIGTAPPKINVLHVVDLSERTSQEWRRLDLSHLL